MPADIGVSGVEKHPSFFRPLFPAFSFFSIYTQSFASRTYGSHLRVSGWISLIPLRPALSSDVSRMISKLESFFSSSSLLPFFPYPLTDLMWIIRRLLVLCSLPVAFSSSSYYEWHLFTCLYRVDLIRFDWVYCLGTGLFSLLFFLHTQRKGHLLSLPLMVMIIRLPRKIRRNEEMNDLVARVLRREYFVLGWLSNLPKKRERGWLTACLYTNAHCLNSWSMSPWWNHLFISSRQASGSILYEVDTCL